MFRISQVQRVWADFDSLDLISVIKLVASEQCCCQVGSKEPDLPGHSLAIKMGSPDR